MIQPVYSIRDVSRRKEISSSLISFFYISSINSSSNTLIITFDISIKIYVFTRNYRYINNYFHSTIYGVSDKKGIDPIVYPTD